MKDVILVALLIFIGTFLIVVAGIGLSQFMSSPAALLLSFLTVFVFGIVSFFVLSKNMR